MMVAFVSGRTSFISISEIEDINKLVGDTEKALFDGSDVEKEVYSVERGIIYRELRGLLSDLNENPHNNEKWQNLYRKILELKEELSKGRGGESVKVVSCVLRQIPGGDWTQ